jgi:hypothetical protein
VPLLSSLFQAPYVESGYTLETASLYSVGYLYLPDKCRTNATTGVFVLMPLFSHLLFSTVVLCVLFFAVGYAL